jgi:hypothetical protein
MNRYILLIAAIAFAIVQCRAQDLKPVLQQTFIQFDSSQDMQQKINYSNKLGLIAKKWPDEWITHYYNAYSKAQLSYREKDASKRDAYLDEAEKEHDEAVSILKKENDETYVLAAMIANARLAVQPATRWQKYGALFSQNLDKAKEINADNPRIYYLQGMSAFFKPKMFGGGKKAAAPYFEKAEGLFAKQSEEDITKPYWGKRANTYFLSQCKSGDDKD